MSQNILSLSGMQLSKLNLLITLASLPRLITYSFVSFPKMISLIVTLLISMLSVEAYDNSKVIIDPQQESRHWENNYNNFNNASQHRQLRIDGCYNKWSKFRDDVAKSKGYETFVICPGTTFQPHAYYEKHSDTRQSQLTINAAAVKLLCGDDGSFSNDCTITGGLSHIEVSSDAGADVLISGITFKDASGSVILAHGSKYSHMKVKDCRFENNGADGGSAIRIHATGDDDNAMDVHVDGCTFVKNYGNLGVIHNHGGKVEIRNSLFLENEEEWTVIVQSSASIEMEYSCFDDDYAAVYVKDDSYIIENSFNHADNLKHGCAGMFLEPADKCSKFSEDDCLAEVTTNGEASSGDGSGKVVAIVVFIFIFLGLSAIYTTRLRRKEKKFDDISRGGEEYFSENVELKLEESMYEDDENEKKKVTPIYC